MENSILIYLKRILWKRSLEIVQVNKTVIVSQAIFHLCIDLGDI